MRDAACAGGGGTNGRTHPRRSPAVQKVGNGEEAIATPTNGAQAKRRNDGGPRGAVPLRLATTRCQATAESRGDAATRRISTTADVGVSGLRAARRADRARVGGRGDEVGGDEEDGVGEPRAVAGAAAARDKAGAAAEERHGRDVALFYRFCVALF